MTLIDRHLARHRALATAEEPKLAVASSEYNVMMAALSEHKRKLKQIQSQEKKIEYKQRIVSEFDEWVSGVLDADTNAYDEIVSTMFVWNIDAGRFVESLLIGKHLLKHDTPLPAQFQRDVPTLLQDEFADAALNQQMTEEQAIILLPQVLELTDSYDTPDQAKSRLLKAFGYALMGRLSSSKLDVDQMDIITAQTAMSVLQRAIALNPRVGVKKEIERLSHKLDR